MHSIQLQEWNYVAPWPTTPAESPSLRTRSIFCSCVQHWKIWSAGNHNPIRRIHCRQNLVLSPPHPTGPTSQIWGVGLNLPNYSLSPSVPGASKNRNGIPPLQVFIQKCLPPTRWQTLSPLQSNWSFLGWQLANPICWILLPSFFSFLYKCLEHETRNWNIYVHYYI